VMVVSKVQKEVQKWWDETSASYQRDSNISTHSAHYGPFSPDENELKLLGNVGGKKILEIGCGGGQCSIAFAKQGAMCTGVDISKEQLEYAEELAKKNRVSVKFVQGDIQTLKQFKSSDYDIVFSAFALHYIPDLGKCFKEIYRVLGKKGIVILGLSHPFYDVISPKTMKISRSYNKAGKITSTETWPDGSKHKFVEFLHKISEITDGLIDSGFVLEKVMEPLKLKGHVEWSVGGWEEIYPRKLVKLIGPTIIFKARKP